MNTEKHRKLAHAFYQHSSKTELIDMIVNLIQSDTYLRADTIKLLTDIQDTTEI